MNTIPSPDGYPSDLSGPAREHPVGNFHRIFIFSLGRRASCAIVLQKMSSKSVASCNTGALNNTFHTEKLAQEEGALELIRVYSNKGSNEVSFLDTCQ